METDDTTTRPTDPIMQSLATQLPTNEQPLIRDPDLAAAVEAEMKGLSGKSLEAARAAIRRVHGSGITGQFGELVAAYAAAIRAAVAD